MTDRQRRMERRRGVRVVLSARDQALLRGVARFRVARSSDLARLYFADVSRERSTQRLRQLFDGQLLDVRFGRLSEPNVYSLGPLGRVWAEEHSMKVGRVPSGDLRHHLAVVECWSRLAATTRRRLSLRLEKFQPDWEIREAEKALPVVPDGLIELSRGGDALCREHFVLEVDLATERLEALRSKFGRYALLQGMASDALSWPFFVLVVVLAEGGQRRQEMVSRLLELELPGFFLLLRRDEWPDALLDRVATGALPTDPSSSRERVSHASGVAAATSSQEEAEHSR